MKLKNLLGVGMSLVMLVSASSFSFAESLDEENSGVDDGALLQIMWYRDKLL